MTTDAPTWSYRRYGCTRAEGDRLARSGVWPWHVPMWTNRGYTVTDMIHVYGAADRAGYDDPRRLDVLEWAETGLPPRAVADLIMHHDVESEAVRDAIWVDAGWAPEDVPAWQGLPWDDDPHLSLFDERSGAMFALAYAQHGYQPDAAAAWAPVTENPGEAEALHAAGYTPEMLSDLRQVLPVLASYHLVPALIEEWIPLGLTPDRIRQALLAGYTPDEAADLTVDDWAAVPTLAALRNTPSR